MSSGPPPKEGEVTTSSTKLRIIYSRLEKMKNDLEDLALSVEQILKDNGY